MMRNHEDSGIVADGARRLAKAKNHGQMRQRLLKESVLRHAAENEGASPWRRFWIGMKIRREIRAELAKEFPPAALYLSAAIQNRSGGTRSCIAAPSGFHPWSDARIS